MFMTTVKDDLTVMRCNVYSFTKMLRGFPSYLFNKWTHSANVNIFNYTQFLITIVSMIANEYSSMYW